MSNKKLKNKILKNKILILIFILILTLILAIFVLLILFSKRNSQKEKDAILDRLISGLDNLNYSYNEDENTKVQVVGKLEKKTSSNYEIYTNYESKDVKKLYNNDFILEEYSNYGITDMSYYNMFEPYFNSMEYGNYEYKYIGKKDLGNTKCTVVCFTKKTELAYETEKMENFIWIDDSTNLIKKVEIYQTKTGSKREKISDEEYNFNTGENKLEDVQITEEKLSEYSSETNG